MGPSGAGKDTLLLYLKCWADFRVAVAHRYITRERHQKGENHVFLYEREYEARNAAGLFSMSWSSHGCRYGIGREIEFWMQQGLNVVVNGSRDAYNRIKQDFPFMQGVLVWAPEEVCRRRLLHRSREQESEVLKRLDRKTSPGRGEGVPVVDNSGSVETAGETLRELVEAIY